MQDQRTLAARTARADRASQAADDAVPQPSRRLSAMWLARAGGGSIDSVTLLTLLNPQAQGSGPDPGSSFQTRPPTTLTLDAPDGVFDIKAGDTWPPLRMRAAHRDGLIPVHLAQSLLVRMLGPAGLITGTPEVIDADDEDGFNLRYLWASGDAVRGRYAIELVITWSAERVETVPSFRGPVVQVNAALV